MDQNSDLAALDKLKLRIQALRAKTIDTEDEALSAAAKVVELLDRSLAGASLNPDRPPPRWSGSLRPGGRGRSVGSRRPRSG